MNCPEESDYAEVIIDRLILESIPEEQSAYFQDESDLARREAREKLRKKVVWHINHSLSRRQKEVVKLLLLGKKQVEIAGILGIKQQVVNIYKNRAIKKLRDILKT